MDGRHVENFYTHVNAMPNPAADLNATNGEAMTDCGTCSRSDAEQLDQQRSMLLRSTRTAS